LQSAGDFPVMVTLGDKQPVWGLSRWNGAGLRFRPDREDGFVLRGDGRQLLYQGRERSHRFTILGDNSFEYDCILNKAPDTNTVILRLEGAEGFDFFRQPDGLPNPLLAGSYAVYKKDTFLGNGRISVGTGKLCHIHRPKIIDAAGRWVWGDLSINGDRLYLTIPEGWLSEARYPVIVDPIIGSTTAGSQYYKYYISEEEYTDLLDMAADEGWSNAELQEELQTYKLVMTKHGEAVFNKFLVNETLQGQCKAYLYVGKLEADPYACAAPLLFSDSGNMPNVHLSNQEYALCANQQNAVTGWKSINFDIPNQIGANTHFWFGIYAYSMGINFDYGVECFDIAASGNPVSVTNDTQNGLDVHNRLTGIQQNIALYKEEINDEEYARDMRLFLDMQYRNVHPLRDSRYDLKMSIYFQVISTAYTRTLTQGVTLLDNRKRVHGMARVLTQTINLSQITGKAHTAIRKAAEAVGAGTTSGRTHNAVRETNQNAGISDSANREKGMYRFIVNLLGVTENNTAVRSLARLIYSGVTAFLDLGQRREVNRGITDGVNQTDTVNRSRGFFAFLQSFLKTNDHTSYTNQWRRNVPDTAHTVTDNRHIGNYQRGLSDTLNGTGETNNRADYLRVERDTGDVIGEVQRMVHVFIRLITGGAVRDYIIRRFLKSNEEMVVKSPVCREITIESRIH
jgi:hypothetical protein